MESLTLSIKLTKDRQSVMCQEKGVVEHVCAEYVPISFAKLLNILVDFDLREVSCHVIFDR